jgi:hypothetical protein
MIEVTARMSEEKPKDDPRSCMNCRYYSFHTGWDLVNGIKVYLCQGNHDVTDITKRAFHACYRPYRMSLKRYGVSFCRNCGIMLWYHVKPSSGKLCPPCSNKYGKYCSQSCMREAKDRMNAFRHNPLGIDMTIDRESSRSTCAVMVCDIVNRCREKILDGVCESLHLDQAMRDIITAETDKIRVAWLKRVKCIQTHARHIIAGALVYIACRSVGVMISQDLVAKHARCSAAAIRSVSYRIVESHADFRKIYLETRATSKGALE